MVPPSVLPFVDAAIPVKARDVNVEAIWLFIDVLPPAGESTVTLRNNTSPTSISLG